MTIDARNYSISIRQVCSGNQVMFEASVGELPDVYEYGETPSEAYELTLETISTAAEMLAEEGRCLPSPRAIENEFSGRVTLRLTKSLHRSASIFAEREGVSLNHFLSMAIAEAVGGRRSFVTETQTSVSKLAGMVSQVIAIASDGGTIFEAARQITTPANKSTPTLIFNQAGA